MIDLHTHLLPGIDDGPKTLEESLEMCRIAVANGTTHTICTPHIHPGRWGNTAESIAQETQNLRLALQENDIPLELGFAAEVRLTDDIPRQIKQNEIPFYGEVDGYQIMLLEFPHAHIVPGSDKLASWLLNQGIRPLIAHPERNKQIMKEPNRLAPFLEMGCWLQVTAGSIVGNFGEAAQAIARELLDNNAATVIASDGHNATARQPTLKQAFTHIAKRYGEDRATELTQYAPERIAGAQW